MNAIHIQIILVYPNDYSVFPNDYNVNSNDPS